MRSLRETALLVRMLLTWPTLILLWQGWPERQRLGHPLACTPRGFDRPCSGSAPEK